MKYRFFLILFYITIPNLFVASENDTTLFIEGYLVYNCNKDKINFFYQQNLLKEIARTTNNKITTYDFLENRCNNYFIRVDNNKRENNTILSDLKKDSNTDTVIIFANDLATDCFTCSKKEINNIIVNNLILKAAWGFSPYYDFGKELKKIIYIEGQAAYFDKQFDSNNATIQNAFIDNECNKLLIITKIINYSTIIDLPNLKVWYPYLE